eukprot:5247836-Karenia_brevis.AAC.1
MEAANSATQRPDGRKEDWGAKRAQRFQAWTAPTKEPVLTLSNRRRQRASKAEGEGAKLRSSAQPESGPADKIRLNKKQSAMGERALRSAPATGEADGCGSETTTRQRFGGTR